MKQSTQQPLSYTSSFSSSSLTCPCLLRDHNKQPHHSMSSVSSHLAHKGKLKLSITTTDLLVLFILTLYVTNCEARNLRVHGKHCSSNKLTSSSPPKQAAVIDGGAAKDNTRSSSETPVGSKMDASTMVNEAVTAVAKKKEVASSSSSGDSCRGSLRKAFEATKVRRSGIGERSVLGADAAGSNSEQVGSNTTAGAAYTAETLVAMDYQDAQPAPAVHNR